MSQAARLDPHHPESRAVQFDQAAADRFFGRITIVAGSIGIISGVLVLLLIVLGR
jgi:hypothetical protein